jgi:general L-amino acid transport system substrate-binding protein
MRLEDPAESVVLPENLSKEPFGPVVLQGDDRWFAVVKWVHFALLNAEELGVTSANVDAMMSSPNEDIRNLLGSEGAFGEGIGLTNDWAARTIRLVGNYGEIFERNLGSGSPLAIPRGLNALWSNGGIQFAPPIR